MNSIQRLVSVLVIALGMICMGAAAEAQVTASEERSPAGIVFRHIAMPGDTHHALAFGWIDGTELGAGGKEGIAAASVRLLLEGSRTINESERIERLRDLQGGIGLSGSLLYTRALVTAPRATFSETARLLADLLSDPALPAKKLALARRNAEINWPQARENAEALAGQLFLRLVLGKGPFLSVVLGDPAAQASISVSDVDAWRKAVLGHLPVAIVSAGPLPVEEVGREIDRLLKGLPAAQTEVRGLQQVRKLGKLVVLERAAVQTAIVAGGPSGWTTDPDVVRGTLAIRVLGGGFDSRLTKAVREGLGATYGIRASLMQLHPKAFILNISSQVDNARALKALEAIRNEYALLLKLGVSDGEIAPLKTRLVTEAREQVRRSPGAAQSLRDVLLSGLPQDHLTTYEARVQTVTAEMVNEGIRDRLPSPPLTIVMITPSAEGLDADCVIKAPEEIDKCE